MIRQPIPVLAAIAIAATSALPAEAKKKTAPAPSALDTYIESALGRSNTAPPASTGSLFSPLSPLGDLARDLRASQVDDIVTILVAERASATSSGTTNTARKSDVKASVGAVFGATAANGGLSNLASATSESQLQGQGSTSRESVLSTTLAARVTHVLPNGYLVVEGRKEVVVNSENQVVSVRGVLRPADLTPGNLARSDRLAQMEIRINGKGVVGDAIRRPFFLYRILMGLLPF